MNWAVINGEKETGATLHVMTEFADRGDIIAQKSVPINFEDTAHDVFLKVTEASREILLSSLPHLKKGLQKDTLRMSLRRQNSEDAGLKTGKLTGTDLPMKYITL